MDAVVLPFTKVARQAFEEKAGSCGVTAQTGCVQQCAAQRSPGKVGGVHGRWNLRVSPNRSTKGCTVFIIRDSFSSNVLCLVTGGMLLDGPTLASGDIPHGE